MISLENLKQLSELQQDFANSEYLAQATSLGSIFDTMMFPDYDNAINLVDVNRHFWQAINFNYEFTENGFLFCHLRAEKDVRGDAEFAGTLTTEKGEVFDISDRSPYGSASDGLAFLTLLIPVFKGMKLHISYLICSKYDRNRISFLPLKEIE
jgi:hypothetical protein